ncbi:double-strand break repair helicase AddA [Gymnodinialimonas sp. 2305UL16-5]|uniref:double-strand break repair helicase AddA n=1 Tax=Gymnodinialimonas mytili TaxID=3126503 RepID=UPI00309771C0
MVNDATRAQNAAADPRISTWLGANAGSGKTRVLTDRVARLLLDGVPPERILCLTYTKAAAMEMQNRLFTRLGQWAMKSDIDLREMLLGIGVEEDTLSVELLNAARTLFARAIEAPGGLKIQTIHSFCASVLRRFPLEAGVSPAFTEIDERAQKRLISDLLDTLADTDHGLSAIQAVAPHLSGDDGLTNLARAVAGRSADLTAPADWNMTCAYLGIPQDLTEAKLIASVFQPGLGQSAARMCRHFDPTPRSSTASVLRVFENVTWDAPRLSDLALLESVLLTGEKSKVPFAPKINKIGNADIRIALGDDLHVLNALIEAVAEVRPLRTGFATAQRTFALHQFATAFLPAYAMAKQTRGWLDFDDLITRMNQLLTDRDVAQWVLFRLDGGIDHILVDEAQDTSPRQWQIVSQLADDFAAGVGARADVQRTIFVVGDKKQSIYSFQGADPSEFDRMRGHFKARLDEINAPFQPDAALIHSFRSAPPILALVDHVAMRLGAPGLGDDITHRAFFGDKPGRVDLWPWIEPVKGSEDPTWDDPQDLVAEDHHSKILAETLAARIADMLATPPEINGRALGAGDILILVRSRSPLFHKIIAALKLAGLPVAGVDRSQLTAPLAVKDLLALCRFLATQEDDLSLAAVLRSPLCNMSEADLYSLAHGREGYLWPALRKRHDDFPNAYGMLSDLISQAEFLQPYDLLERALIRYDGRRNLTARLGAEAEDAIDAILAQAMVYEVSDVPSLTGFIGWLESGEVQVKRDLSQAEGQIRVMTVHGAKGLEAPVVILPDCAMARGSGPGIRLLQPEDGPLLWSPGGSDASDEARALDDARKAREAEEANRLLYVALTRAESWLIIAAAGQLGRAAGGSWYKIVADAMEAMKPEALTIPGLEGNGQRVQTGAWPNAATRTVEVNKVQLPAWADTPAPRPEKDIGVRSPSDLGGAKALPGESDDTDTAMKRGRIAHLFLEHLPLLPLAAWQSASAGIAALDGDISDLDLGPILAEAVATLTTPQLSHVFAQDTLAEVEITGESNTLGGPMFGKIDRLIVTDTHVLAVDFKTNATVPAAPDEVPEGLLRQMGAYAEMLKPIYPHHKIETAILWSRTATLMPLPHDLVSAALDRARGA